MAKTETIEEFLARGGTINRIPSVQSPESGLNPIKIRAVNDISTMSLSDGESFFGEKAKKRKPKISLIDVVGKFNLPQDLVAKLKGEKNNDK